VTQDEVRPMDEPAPTDILAIIAGQYDCVAEVVAERDRLRAVVAGCPRCEVHAGQGPTVETAEVHGELIVRMRESVWREHEAERDRLRAVEGAVRTMMDNTGDDDAFTAVERALATLDRSPTIGGTP
jgi:hypothetical protein